MSCLHTGFCNSGYTESCAGCTIPTITISIEHLNVVVVTIW
tara:strand:+ start:47715 stop:47837 length:123 start_codon:yes stop_codon:yes gene_type:complete